MKTWLKSVSLCIKKGGYVEQVHRFWICDLDIIDRRHAPNGTLVTSFSAAPAAENEVAAAHEPQ